MCVGVHVCVCVFVHHKGTVGFIQFNFIVYKFIVIFGKKTYL